MTSTYLAHIATAGGSTPLVSILGDRAARTWLGSRYGRNDAMKVLVTVQLVKFWRVLI